MPTVLRIKGYQFFFFSLEGKEPPHIHVEQAERYAKLWLDPIQIVQNNKELFKERWHEHFGHKV